MKNMSGQEIIQGLYMTWDGNINNLKFYKVHKKEKELVATDMNGNSFSIKDPGFYNRKRNPIYFGTLDSFNLILVENKDYELLENELINSQKKISKLLQMLRFNKDTQTLSKCTVSSNSASSILEEAGERSNAGHPFS